jgi:hypothetical protein
MEEGKVAEEAALELQSNSLSGTELVRRGNARGSAQGSVKILSPQRHAFGGMMINQMASVLDGAV